MGTVHAVFVSPERGSGQAVAMDAAQAIAGYGFAGCQHANPPRREVLFASKLHLDALSLQPGAIRENITVDGDDVQTWPVGQRVQVGGALFEITMVCDPCERMEKLRPGLRAELEGRRGMLARVLETGSVAVGDEIALQARDVPATS